MTYRDDSDALRARVATLDAELDAEKKKRIAAEASERAARAAVAEEKARGNRPPQNSRLPWVVAGICCATLITLLVGQHRSSDKALAEETLQRKNLEEKLAKEREDCRRRSADYKHQLRNLWQQEGSRPLKTLSRSQIQRGMRLARPLVQGCYDKFRVPGLANVQLKISPDGSISSSRIKGFFTGTPTGKCVLDAVQTARFPRFTGEPITITYPFVLR